MNLNAVRKYISIFAPLVFALGLAWFGYLPWLDRAFFGLASSVNIHQPADDNVVIVGIDDNSIATLGHWPWPRELQAQLLDRVTEAGALATGYNILLTEPSKPHADQKLADAILHNGRVVLTHGFANLDEPNSVKMLEPLPLFSRHAASNGFDLVVHETDGKVEYCCLRIEQNNLSLTHFSQVLMMLASPSWTPPKPLEDGLLERPYKHICDQNAVGIDFDLLNRPTPEISALDVLLGRANSALHNKIVLIGLTANGLAPRFVIQNANLSAPKTQRTEDTLINGLELNAVVLRTLKNNTGLRDAALHEAFAFLAAWMLLLLWLNVNPKTKRHIFTTHGLMTVGALGSASVIFYTMNTWMPVSPLLAGIALSLILGLRAQFGIIQSDALTDPLTQLSNRRAIEQNFVHILRRAQRQKQIVALIMLDIDFFKKYNDLYGHQQGDQALRTLGQLLNNSIRMDTDSAARLGGEEFGILLTLPDAAGALVFAQRLRHKLEQKNIPHEASPFKHLTVSMGIALCADGSQGFADLYKAADESLYEAKHNGRNQAGSVVVINAHTHPNPNATALASDITERRAQTTESAH